MARRMRIFGQQAILRARLLRSTLLLADARDKGTASAHYVIQTASICAELLLSFDQFNWAIYGFDVFKLDVV